VRPVSTIADTISFPWKKVSMRKLGHSGIKVGSLAFGGNVFGWTADEPTSSRLLDAFIDSGLNLIDTADVYSTWVPGHVGGESETVIGRWLIQSGKRDKVIIATKVGKPMPPDRKGLSRRYIEEAVDASLQRLQTDHIDLYQSHEDDPNTPLDETLRAFDDLVKKGKVRAIGASNFSGPRLDESLKVSRELGIARYETLQPEYNLYARSKFETELQPICRREGIGVIPYFSLASGFLTGKYRSEQDLGKSARGGGIRKYLNPRGERILSALDEVAKQYSATPAQVALAWLMTQPTIVAPLVSATSVAQWKELRPALNLKLDQEALSVLDSASAE
jgi:aryl-alcohol dehydrogenase-like predicted oxidoreductase